MKALFLVQNFPPLVGGSCNYYESIYRHYPAKKVRIVTPDRENAAAFDGGFPQSVHRFANPKRALFRGRLADVPEYSRWLRLGLWFAGSFKPDVIHCGEVLPNGLIGLILKRTLGIPYIVFVHGEELVTQRRLRYQSTVQCRILESADHVIAACSMAKAEVEDIVQRRPPISLALPGVELQRFRPEVDTTGVIERYALGGKKVLLTVGLLDEARKGHDVVIRAMPQILAHVPNALYLVAGRGERRHVLQAEAERLGVGHAVRFLGTVPADELPPLYAAADVFVMPNRQVADGLLEGFGMVFLEASACGTPVIAGRSGGTADSVRESETGFRVDPLDVSEVARRVVELFVDESRAAAMGAAGRRFAENGFEWESRARHVLQISEEVARRASPRRSGNGKLHRV